MIAPPKNYFPKFICWMMLLLISHTVKSQLPGYSLIDSTSEWYVYGSYVWGDFSHCNQEIAISNSVTRYYIDADTTINLKTYFMMRWESTTESYCVSDTTIQWTESSSGNGKLIREEDNRIYVFVPSNVDEVLVYDYNSISIGDVLNPNCTVGSIDTLYLLHQPYLKYNCECNNEFLIQGIGTKRALFSTLDCGIGIEGDLKNMCYRKNDFVINIDPTSDCTSTGDTSVFVGLKETLNETALRIYPNPTKGHLELEVESDVIKSYTLFSIDGKQLLKGRNIHSNRLALDLSNLENGLYILFTEMKNGGIARELIVKTNH